MRSLKMAEGFNIQKETLKTNLLGQILLKKGLVTNEQLQKALSLQKEKKSLLLGDILLDLGYISEEKLSMALATQTGLPYIPIGKYKISAEVLKIVPRELVLKYCFVPLEKIGRVLTIAITNPFNREAISQIETMTQHRIVCLIAAKTQIEKVIRANY